MINKEIKFAYYEYFKIPIIMTQTRGFEYMYDINGNIVSLIPGLINTTYEIPKGILKKYAIMYR